MIGRKGDASGLKRFTRSLRSRNKQQKKSGNYPIDSNCSWGHPIEAMKTQETRTLENIKEIASGLGIETANEIDLLDENHTIDGLAEHQEEESLRGRELGQVVEEDLDEWLDRVVAGN